MSWYLAVLKNYAGFRGRARRKEYWMFVLLNIVVVVALLVVSILVEVLLQVGTVAEAIIPYLIYLAATCLPALAAAVRRLHDTGRSGWWMLISAVPVVGAITLLVFLATEGAAEENKYGPDPKGGH